MWFETSEYITNGYKVGEFIKTVTLLKRGIYIDTGPLFLLIVGHHDRIKGNHLLKKFEYSKFDYKCLLAFLNSIKLHKYSLLVTPHIFTEFVKHLWELSEYKSQFGDILETSFKTKWFVKDTEEKISCFDFMNHEKFINKDIEIGDISICICANEAVKRKGPITILTDDMAFAEVADKKYKFLSIYYQEIKSGTLLLKTKNIPEEFLREPIQRL